MNFDLITNHITPRFVIDVGARCGDWAREAKAVWPEANFFLVEGNPECEPTLKESGFPYAIALLSDQEKEVDFYTIKDCPMATGASIYRENTPFFADDKVKIQKLFTKRLDDVVAGFVGGGSKPLFNIHDYPILLKLDAQGSELDIMNGAPEIMAIVPAIVCEVAVSDYNIGAPLADKVSEFLLHRGFQANAILENIVHPLERDKVIQMDMLFLKLKAYGG